MGRETSFIRGLKRERELRAMDIPRFNASFRVVWVLSISGSLRMRLWSQWKLMIPWGEQSLSATLVQWGSAFGTKVLREVAEEHMYFSRGSQGVLWLLALQEKINKSSLFHLISYLILGKLLNCLCCFLCLKNVNNNIILVVVRNQWVNVH